MTETGIAHHARLPVAWRDVTPADPADTARIASLMHDNVLTLQALAALETAHSASSTDRDNERAPVDHHNARLEAKIDLMLHWMAQLLLERHPLPPPSDMVLSAHAIDWACPVALTAGSEGIISIFLARGMPAALNLPARVIHYEQGRAQANFLHMSNDAQEWWERTLFRYHRRALHARSQR